MEPAQGVNPLATRSRRELLQRHFATSTVEPMASSVAAAGIASRNLVGLTSMDACRIGTPHAGEQRGGRLGPYEPVIR